MNQHDFGERAEDNLRFIRSTMERSTRFTAVSGWGGVGMGVVGLIAAVAATRYPVSSQEWMMIWLVGAAVAAPVGAVSIWYKAARTNVAFNGAAGRAFALCFFPVVAAGAIVTWTVATTAPGALPAVWLSMYGAAITAGSAFSVRILPVMGAGFLLLGAAAGLVPSWGNMALLLGFGVLHVGFGAFIAARYDG
ncbi:MAG: hypothetical protein OEM96_01265 [Gemmatimonadota bacterium]|nr:hypothetical protein [Gemmatimonadota bacterium]